MTEQDIQYVLGRHLFLKNICIPNVMMRDSGKPPYEADFVYFNLNTLHLTEVEIKTDINDFRNDFKKSTISRQSQCYVFVLCNTERFI